jgi:hypothetical protein
MLAREGLGPGCVKTRMSATTVAAESRGSIGGFMQVIDREPVTLFSARPDEYLAVSLLVVRTHFAKLRRIGGRVDVTAALIRPLRPIS